MPKEALIILFLVLDLILIALLFWFYLKFRRLLELPLEEIQESIYRAQELVRQLERLEVKAGEKPSSSNLREEILVLFRKGLTPKEISKRLGLSQGEVELLLKSERIRIE